ncbi:MAG: hypothetical protein M3Z54_14440 [Gemmatimonadota bacterium]|nr:hypothetical protein [Gemmatimonadota bacterium]
MMARAKVLMTAALLIGGATACSDLTGNTSRADGVYYLQTYNNTPLPYTYRDANNNTITIQSDTYSLNSDGSYTEFATYLINNATQSQTESGTWSQSGSVVTFYPSQSTFGGTLTPYTGNLGNSSSFSGARTLSFNISGTTAIYSQ